MKCMIKKFWIYVQNYFIEKYADENKFEKKWILKNEHKLVDKQQTFIFRNTNFHLRKTICLFMWKMSMYNEIISKSKK